MKKIKLKYALLLLPLFLTGCGGNKVCDDPIASDSVLTEWRDNAIDCMNGYFIVPTGSEFGITDTAGRVIVQPIYSELFFLSDDIAAGYESGYWNFLNTNGKVLARAEGTECEDAEQLMSLYDTAKKKQDAEWENIVLTYEDFCGRCSASNMDIAELQTLADDLITKIQCTDGFMSDIQRQRIEQAHTKYRSRD